MSSAIFIYSDKRTNRLVYVLDWLFNHRFKTGYELVYDANEVPQGAFFISYGKHLPGALSIPDSGLLWQQDIQEHSIETGAWKGVPTLYTMPDASCTLPFDLFSALFFLLSRYEEYYPFTPDKYERYPATDSILYKKGCLQRPLTDEWLQQLLTLLQTQYGLPINKPAFSFQPTYDIDIAYSYLHKGPIRTAGAFVRDALKGKTALLKERASTLTGKLPDPYNSFEWLQHLHKENHCKPIYFMLSSLQTTAYDKNIFPLHPKMKKLTEKLSNEGSIGIHPSYFSGHGETLKKEKQTLESIIARDVNISRQHYIRIQTPATYRLLIQNNITHDYSMGYGTHLGFRAGTGSAFYWYDLQKETITNLQVHPFCFMDTTAMFEEKLSIAKAFQVLENMRAILEQTGSTLITVFHNFSLGTAIEWKGWKEYYEKFIREIMA